MINKRTFITYVVSTVFKLLSSGYLFSKYWNSGPFLSVLENAVRFGYYCNPINFWIFWEGHTPYQDWLGHYGYNTTEYTDIHTCTSKIYQKIAFSVNYFVVSQYICENNSARSTNKVKRNIDKGSGWLSWSLADGR